MRKGGEITLHHKLCTGKMRLFRMSIRQVLQQGTRLEHDGELIAV
jgi:hypothetical protein